MTDTSVEALQATVQKLEASVAEKDARIAILRDEVRQAVELDAKNREQFYLTTAIHYTNGAPHIGHAYENTMCDIIVRYHRMFGRDVFFLTGTDEHGQKVVQTAEAQGITPMELVDKSSGLFQQLTKDLNMSNNNFIRTTSEVHKKFARWLFQRALDAGDIYLGEYEGWYNVREEAFVTESEAQQTDYKDQTSGLPYKKMQEKSYFFKMSRYQERLIQHFHDHPDFLQPENRRQEILRRLQEPLQDLSCSRAALKHGITLPNDPTHVMYVWFDALSNYCSGVGYPDGEHAKYWPASVHIIGKDIMWFHTVIWPCILMSAGLPLPKRVYAHGFVNDKDGKKMSKSIGNVVDPYDIIGKYGLDSFRYFVARACRFGSDFPFSESDLINIHNAELADTLGNLVHRAVNMTKQYSNGVVPDAVSDTPFEFYALLRESEAAFKNYDPQAAALAVVSALRDTNKYLTDKAPWHMKELEPRLVVVRTVLEALYICAHFISPFIPSTADVIFEKLGTAPITLTQLSPAFDNLKPGTTITIGNILFQKLISDEDRLKKEAADATKAAASKPKVEKVAKPLFASLDVRVGIIRKVWEHPDSEKLYCEEIDVGEDEPRQIASGLRPHYTLEEMQGRKVLTLLNLKPAKMGGFKSCGMVLCATSDDHEKCEFIEPPADAQPGDRVKIATESGEPVTPAQLKKQKIWEKASVDLVTDADCVATYKGQVWQTSSGPCRAKTMANVHIT